MRLRIYRYEGRWWHGGITHIGWKEGRRVSILDYVREIMWLMGNGHFDCGWHWPELVFGAGREWYDGPIWYMQFGFFGFSLAASD